MESFPFRFKMGFHGYHHGNHEKPVFLKKVTQETGILIKPVTRHINNVTKKANRKIGIMKNMIGRYKMKQDKAILFHKTITRPTVEYGSEIFGSASKTNLNKIDSAENKSLTAALGVCRLAKKTEVNLVAKVLPISLRRDKKLVKTYIRTSTKELGIRIRKSIRKKLRNPVEKKTVGYRLIERVTKLKIDLISIENNHLKSY